jgi:hypothetical protein
MLRLLFIVLLSVAGFAQAGGQVNVWIPRGPEGGGIGRPVIDPQNPGTIYASAGGTVSNHRCSRPLERPGRSVSDDSRSGSPELQHALRR